MRLFQIIIQMKINSYNQIRIQILRLTYTRHLTATFLPIRKKILKLRKNTGNFYQKYWEKYWEFLPKILGFIVICGPIYSLKHWISELFVQYVHMTWGKKSNQKSEQVNFISNQFISIPTNSQKCMIFGVISCN